MLSTLGRQQPVDYEAFITIINNIVVVTRIIAIVFAVDFIFTRANSSQGIMTLMMVMIINTAAVLQVPALAPGLVFDSRLHY